MKTWLTPMKFVLLFTCLCCVASTHADVVLSSSAKQTIQEVAAGQTVTLQSTSMMDRLAAGWQVNLQIIRESGVGTVSFAAPTLPTSNYFLGTQGQNSLGFTQTTEQYNNDRIKILDFDGAFPIHGTNINGMRNLAELSFETSNDANGVFGIYLLNGPGFLSEWTEIKMGNVLDNAFTGSPNQSTPFRIGEITSVPEPSSFWFAVLALTVASVNLWVSRAPQGNRI